MSRPDEPPEAVPTLETERLVLRLPTAREARAVLSFVRENEEHLRPFEPVRPAEHFTLAFHRAALARAARDASADRHYRWWLFGKDAPARAIGNVGVSNVARGAFQSAHLGFALAAEAQGKGLMHEALEAVVRCAFGELNLHRLEANHLPDNARSARLLARLGFERIGLAPRYLRIAGQWRDHVQTQRTNEGSGEP